MKYINEEALEAIFPKIRRSIEMIDLAINQIEGNQRSSVITSAINYLSQLIQLVLPNSISSIPNSNRIKFKWFKEEYQLELEVIPDRPRSAFHISKKNRDKTNMWLVDSDAKVFETIFMFLISPYSIWLSQTESESDLPVTTKSRYIDINKLPRR